jgi:hypothetical protein
VTLNVPIFDRAIPDDTFDLFMILMFRTGRFVVLSEPLFLTNFDILGFQNVVLRAKETLCSRFNTVLKGCYRVFRPDMSIAISAD